MLHRQKKLRREAYLNVDRVYEGASQPTGTMSEVRCPLHTRLYQSTREGHISDSLHHMPHSCILFQGLDAS